MSEQEIAVEYTEGQRVAIEGDIIVKQDGRDYHLGKGAVGTIQGSFALNGQRLYFVVFRQCGTILPGGAIRGFTK